MKFLYLEFISRALEKISILPTLETQIREKTLSASGALSIIAPELPLSRYLLNPISQISE
jgi:hypothetical protein